MTISEYFIFDKDPLYFGSDLSPALRVQLVKEAFQDFFLFSGNEERNPITTNETNVFIDALLGLRIESISYQISKMDTKTLLKKYGQEKILENHPTPLQLTSYYRLHSILKKLNPLPGQTVIDIGSGFGRMGFLIFILYPEVKFIGYEILKERFAESKRVARSLNLPDEIKFIHAHVGKEHFELASAEFYFIYDSLTPQSLNKTLENLYKVSQNKKIKIAVSGIFVFNTLQTIPWLTLSHRNDSLGFAIFKSQ